VFPVFEVVPVLPALDPVLAVPEPVVPVFEGVVPPVVDVPLVEVPVFDVPLFEEVPPVGGVPCVSFDDAELFAVAALGGLGWVEWPEVRTTARIATTTNTPAVTSRSVRRAGPTVPPPGESGGGSSATMAFGGEAVMGGNVVSVDSLAPSAAVRGGKPHSRHDVSEGSNSCPLAHRTAKETPQTGQNRGMALLAGIECPFAQIIAASHVAS
jgi:hypothetical protein